MYFRSDGVERESQKCAGADSTSRFFDVAVVAKEEGKVKNWSVTFSLFGMNLPRDGTKAEECGGGDGTSRFSFVVLSEKEEEEGQSIKNWSVTFSV